MLMCCDIGNMEAAAKDVNLIFSLSVVSVRRLIIWDHF